MKRKLFCFCVLVGLCAVSGRLDASQVISANMVALAKAELVFTGTCAKAESFEMENPKFKGGIIATKWTFNVLKDGVIKGDVPKTFAFTQFGAPRAESERLEAPFIVGVPLYEIGKEYTLFLTSESPLGLRAPLGLGGGKFSVIAGAGGKKQVVNEFDNNGLFEGAKKSPSMSKAMKSAGLSPDAPPGGPLDYDVFVGLAKETGRAN